MCDHDLPGYCLSHRILPDGFRPGVDDPNIIPFSSHPAATWMSPTDITTAYSIPASSKGAGRIVAVVDAPDSHAFDDVTTYRAGFSLPVLPKCAGGIPDGKTACFGQVDEDGNPESTEDCGGKAGEEYDGETGLDIAMASAGCPDCAILLVQTTSWYTGKACKLTNANFIPGLMHGVATAAKLGASATSMSFGGPETGTDPTGYTTPGHLVLAASGDDGYDLAKEGGKSPSYPASAPDILGVGGTNLAKSGSTYTESVWNNDVGASSSGCSGEFPMPSFQKTYLASHSGAFAGCTMRASADVSAAASFGPGTGGGETDGIASVDQGQWINVWGTSAASPMVAAILTRLNLTNQIAADLGYVYTQEASFNDVTTGEDNWKKDTSCTSALCVAGVGWDGPTGLGTPNGKALLASASGGMDGGAEGGKPRKDAGADGSSEDSGTAKDAGSGEPDAGSTADAGGPSERSDAATGDEEFGSSSSSGCGCKVAGEGSSRSGAMLAMSGLALAFVARRRLRHAARPRV
jgi:MYXO-CTERM domain-containing protein